MSLVNFPQPLRSLAKGTSPTSMGTSLGLSILHNIIFTLFAGVIFSGGLRVYWYARVDITLSGNCADILLMKYIIDPIPVEAYRVFPVAYTSLPAADAAYCSSKRVQSGQRQ